jgi:hypothetical protein
MNLLYGGLVVAMQASRAFAEREQAITIRLFQPGCQLPSCTPMKALSRAAGLVWSI